MILDSCKMLLRCGLRSSQISLIRYAGLARMSGSGRLDTHFNCDFEDLEAKKRVVTNQKGYRRSELETFDASKVVKVETLLDSEANA